MGADFRRMINDAIVSQDTGLYEAKEQVLSDIEDLLTWDDDQNYNDDELEW